MRENKIDIYGVDPWNMEYQIVCLPLLTYLQRFKSNYLVNLIVIHGAL